MIVCTLQQIAFGIITARVCVVVVFQSHPFVCSSVCLSVRL